jgi:hypothetical protein
MTTSLLAARPPLAFIGLLVVTLLAACEAPRPTGIDNVAGTVAPRFGGGGQTPAPPTPPGLDTLPAPPPPVGSPSTSPRVVVWALTDSAGTATLLLGDVTTSSMPNVTCFASVNPTLTPWVSVPAGAILLTPYCVTQVVGTTAYAVFGGLLAGEYVATVARF